MERELINSRIHKVEKANHLGWDLNFNTTADATTGAVNSVNVDGYSTENGQERLNVSANSGNTNVNVNFFGCKYNSVIADAIIAEIETIFTESEVAVE